MRNSVYWPRCVVVLTIVVVAGMSVASGETFPASFAEQPPVLAGQTLSVSGVPALQGIVDSGRNADLRWPDFTPYKTEVAKLYQTSGYSLVWLQNGRVRPRDWPSSSSYKMPTQKDSTPKITTVRDGRAASLNWVNSRLNKIWSRSIPR